MKCQPLAIFLLISICVPHLSAQSASATIESNNGGLLLTPSSSNQTVSVIGSLDLVSDQTTVTLTAEVVAQFLQDIKDLKSEVEQLRTEVALLTVCPHGFYGYNCSIYSGGCGFYQRNGSPQNLTQRSASNVCHSASVCIDTSYNGDYRCECPQDRTGAHCEILLNNPNMLSCSHVLATAAPFPLSDGLYMLDIDGDGPLSSAPYYCDMTTDQGGWTIFASYTGGDNELPFVSDVANLTGNPFLFQYYNTNRTLKQSLSTQNGAALLGKGETLLKRNDGTWLKTSSPPFNGYLKSGIHAYNLSVTTQTVVISASDGTRASGIQGYSTSNIIGGGDFGITSAEFAFDFHLPGVYPLQNNFCYSMYFGSYSAVDLDSDAGYMSNLTLGSWRGDRCHGDEVGHLSLHAAIRDPTLFGSCISNPCRNGATCTSLGLDAGYQCSCLFNYTGHHCEVSLCPPQATHNFNGKCFLAVKDGLARTWSQANSVCQSQPSAWSYASTRESPNTVGPESVFLVDSVALITTQRLMLGVFEFGSAWYQPDGSDNPYSLTLPVPFQLSYPRLVSPAGLTAQSWPVAFLNGGTSNGRYLAQDIDSSLAVTDPFICSVFQQPKGYCTHATEIYWQGSWVVAETACVSMKSHLVSIDSISEQAFLVVKFSHTSNTWIGLYSPYNNRTYVWSNGSPSTFRYWDNTVSTYIQPDASGACVRMQNFVSGTMPWDDDGCSIAQAAVASGYICERPATLYSY